MKNLIKVKLLLLAVTFFSITGCNKDDNDSSNDSNDNLSENFRADLWNYSQYSVNGNQDAVFLSKNSDCIDFQYPLQLVNSNSTSTINSDQDFLQYITNPENFIFDFIFPIEVSLNGSITDINNQEELSQAMDLCLTDVNSPGECFTIDYPIQIENEDGSIVTVTSDDSLIFTDGANFVYPITVFLSDSTEIVVNNDTEFNDIFNECFGIVTCDNCTVTCFSIVYPIDVSLIGGQIQTLQNEEDLYLILSDVNNGFNFNLVYPITIVYEDGSETTLNEQSDFQDAFNNCL
ncbi:MAG: hypothetical protein Wins2KO_12900 [Winogradskyella sp.]